MLFEVGLAVTTEPLDAISGSGDENQVIGKQEPGDCLAMDKDSFFRVFEQGTQVCQVQSK